MFSQKAGAGHNQPDPSIPPISHVHSHAGTSALRHIRTGFQKAGLSIALMGASQAAWAAHDLVLQHTGPVQASITQTATYTVTLDNSHPTFTDTATGVEVTYTYNSSFAQYESATFSNGSGTCSEGSPGVVTCNVDDITHGTTDLTIDFQLLVHGNGLSDQNPPSANLAPIARVTSIGDTEANNDTETVTTNIQAGSDLGVTLASSPSSGGSVQSGGIWEHDVTITNNGPLSTTGTTVTLSPVAGSVWVVSSLPSGCVIAGDDVKCTVSGAFSPSAPQTFSGIQSQVSAASGSALTLTANVSSDLVDEISTNNSSSSSISVTPGTDLTLDLSETVNATIAGDPSTLTVTPQYTGEVPDTPDFTVIIPSGLTVDGSSLSYTGWGDCNFSSVTGPATLTCSNWDSSSAQAGASVPMGPVSFQVTGPTGNYTLNGNISSNSTEANLTNNEDSVSIDFSKPEVNITIAKNGPAAPENKFQTGTDIQYTIVLRNPSSSNIDFWGPLSFTETAPAGLTINSITGPAGWSCDTGGCSRTYTEADPFPRNSSQSFTVSATVNDSSGTALVNQACRSAFTHTLVGEVNPETCNNATAVTGHPVNDSTDLSTTKTVTTPADNIKAGEWLDYSFTVENTGGTANSVTVSDELNGLVTSTTGGSFQITGIPTGWSCTGNGTSLSQDDYLNTTSVNLTCTTTSMSDGDSGTFTFRIRPQGHASNGNSLTRNNRVYVQSDTPEPNFSNNTATADASVKAKTDFTVSKAVTSWDNKTGTELQYTITVSNAELSGANNVIVTDVLPENVTYLGIEGTVLPSCSGLNAGDITTSGNKTLECSWSTFPRGADRSFIVRIRPNHNWQGNTLTNNVYVNVEPGSTNPKSGTTEETDYSNNSDSADAVANEADIDLQVNLMDLSDPVYIGDQVKYQVRITNNGPSVATNASIYEFLPTAGFKWAGDVTFYDVVSGSPVEITDPAAAGLSCGKTPAADAIGTGGEDANNPDKLSWLWPANEESWSTSEPSYNPDYVNGAWDSRIENNADIICNMGLLESGQTRVLEYTLEATDRGVYMNYAIVRSQEHIDRAGNNFTDRHWANDVIEHRTTVRSLPDATFNKEVSLPEVSIMEPFNYTITVSNNDPLTQLYYPEVQDTLPANMELTGTPVLEGTLVGGQFSCTTIPVSPDPASPSQAGDTNFACTLGEGVPPASQVVIRVPVRVIGGDAVTLTNNAALRLDSDLEFDSPPPPYAEDDVDVDVVISSLAGRVYHDDDDTGSYTSGTNPPISGVTILLTGTDDFGNSVNRSTVTNANGEYSFTHLAPGDYTVTEEHPVSWIDAKETIGSVGGDISTNDVISNIPLPAKTDATEYNFGELRNLGAGVVTASISGHVYHDRNNNGIFDTAESPISSVIVQLSGNNGDTRTTTTDGNGYYAFNGLEPGAEYTVTEVHPDGWADGRETDGSVFTNTSNSNDVFIVNVGDNEHGKNWNFGERKSSELINATAIPTLGGAFGLILTALLLGLVAMLSPRIRRLTC